jgi:hypothetical protein
MVRVVLFVLFVFVGGLPALMLVAADQATPDRSKADADAMRKKLTAIVARGEQKTEQKTVQKPSPLRTSFTDREVNA